MCLGGYVEKARAMYRKHCMYMANGVDISCFLLILSLLHTLFCSDGISESPAHKLQVEQAVNDSARILGQRCFPDRIHLAISIERNPLFD